MTMQAAVPLPRPQPDWALFLDIDGTILDIAATPEAVTLPPGLLSCLAELAETLDGAVALVSGRPVAWIDRHFAPLRLAAAGQHGAELRLAAGAPSHAAAAPDDLGAVRHRIERAAKRWPGVVVEPKTFGIGVHFRLAPERADEVGHLLAAIVGESGGRYELLSGKMLLEIKAAGPTKGRVVAAFMTAAPFAGRVPVFVGDDRTDEDGFREVLARGGHAVQVGPRRSALASGFVPDPAALRAWLAQILAAIRRFVT